MTYTASYTVDGKQFSSTMTVRCYFEQRGWINEGGPGWHARSNDPTYTRGTLDDGTPFVIEPFDGNDADRNSGSLCVDRKKSFHSMMFIRVNGGSGALQSFDEKPRQFKGKTIKMGGSSITPYASTPVVYNDAADFKFPPTTTKDYYTISMVRLGGSEIDRLGLRAYVEGRSDFRVMPGVTNKFVEWSDADVQAARAITTQAPVLYWAQDDLGMTGRKNGSEWSFTDRPPETPVMWAPETISESDATRVKDSDVPRATATYENVKVELPTQKYDSRHFYDPVGDQILVFYVTRKSVVTP